MSTEEKNQTEMTDSSENEDEITVKLDKAALGWVLVPLAFAVGLAIGYFTWGQDTAQAAGGAAESEASVVIPEDVPRYEIPIYEDDPVYGDEDALVTIVEFSDYECPFCQKYNLEVFPLIIENYGDQIRYVYKDLPLDNMHPNAIPAAVAGLCANEQGGFWEYHDLLYEASIGLGTQSYLVYAQQVGLDVAAFTDCLEDNPYLESIPLDRAILESLGARLSTPSFFINGIYIAGAQPYELFAQVIEHELDLNE